MLLSNLLRLAIFVASVFQLTLLASGAGRYCTQETGILEMEGVWLLTLAVSQTIATIGLAFWKWIVGRRERTLNEHYAQYHQLHFSSSEQLRL